MNRYMVIFLMHDREYVKLKYTNDYAQAMRQMIECTAPGTEVIIARETDGVILATMTTREEELECSD